MENKDFVASCEAMRSLHFPRWNELPEFELYMDQVIALTEKYLSALNLDSKTLITPSMINNYVKIGVLPPPKNKRYNRTHLALLMIICVTKSVLEISVIADIVNQLVESNDMEKVLGQFAEMYENSVSAAAKKAQLAVSLSNSEQIVCAIAIENALNASAARTVAMCAYNEVATVSPEEPKSKADKKNAKKE